MDAVARGWCRKHYWRWRRHGDLNRGFLSDEDRFLAKVNRITGPVYKDLGRCWTWTGKVDKGGYGRIISKTKGTTKAHRLSWMLFNGSVPDGLCVLHRCDNPRCVNPSHLFLGTNLDNIEDRNNKGRSKGARGESSGTAKLTSAQVLEIRRRHRPRSARNSGAALAREFGVSQATISMLLRGLRWSFV